MAGVRTDRFGNPNILKFAKEVTNKKTGEVMPIYKTYIEIGSTMVKVEVSHANKESKDGKRGMWVKFTKMSKRQQGGGGFGSNQAYSNKL